eukprot:TRINITY_DN563_c1_g1_i1.p1 TRINITY_DN563_c1_g1~~TRINITY_DN563_c1_g1_i1.p1  ORF type:complete len:236 (+),score=50.37 TRINITY_DN563_c1_g1_i1:201-908(+)
MLAAAAAAAAAAAIMSLSKGRKKRQNRAKREQKKQPSDDESDSQPKEQKQQPVSSSESNGGAGSVKKPKPPGKSSAAKQPVEAPKPKPKPKKKNPEDIRQPFHCPRHRLTRKRALGAADWIYDCEICEEEITPGTDFYVCTAAENCTYALCEACHDKEFPKRARGSKPTPKNNAEPRPPTDAKKATLGTRIRPLRSGSATDKTAFTNNKLPLKASLVKPKRVGLCKPPPRDDDDD